MRDIKDIWQVIKDNPGVTPREICLILKPDFVYTDPLRGAVTKRIRRLIRDGDMEYITSNGLEVSICKVGEKRKLSIRGNDTLTVRFDKIEFDIEEMYTEEMAKIKGQKYYFTIETESMFVNIEVVDEKRSGHLV